MDGLWRVVGQHAFLVQHDHARGQAEDHLHVVLDEEDGGSVVSGQQVDLAEQMIRAIARQAEAERERRAKVIHAEGEYMAAEKLGMAAEVIQKQPAALQLRYLQTLVVIGQEKNTTIVFPLPLDILTSLGRALDRVADGPANK